jgi:hypothetical protein
MAYVKLGATLKDCEELAPILREEDLKECRAIHTEDLTALKALEQAVKASVKTFAVIGDQETCIAIFGVGEFNEGVGGCPWMLSSDELFDNHSREFRKQCKGFAMELAKGYKWLMNYVATDNKKAIKWLTWLGFTVDFTRPVTFGNVSFNPFWYKE